MWNAAWPRSSASASVSSDPDTRVEIATTLDKSLLEAWLRRDDGTHIYALADLDDFFFSDTTWYAASEGGQTRAVCLVLDRLALPIVYAIPLQEEDAALAVLLEEISPLLPARFFVNLGLSLEPTLRRGRRFARVGQFQKMVWDGGEQVESVDVSRVEPLSLADRAELQSFYGGVSIDEGGRFFEPFMLETGLYCGIRESGELVSVAGVHVFSERYGVAALGNIATRPDRQGRGLGRAVTAAVCRSLRGRAEHVGLNVKVDNARAIRCYEGLGFRVRCRYLEGVFESAATRADARTR